VEHAETHVPMRFKTANKKQDKDRDPAASTNKPHGKHKAKGHRH